jgi:hypothetical protein
MSQEHENPIDKIIREARESGAFEGLPGKGKPIRWEDESMVPEDQRLAQRLLRSNGYTLDFIAMARELDAEYAGLRANLDQARQKKFEGRLDAAGWEAALIVFQTKVRALNRRVIGYNMRVNSPQLEKSTYPVDPDAA